MLLYRLQSRKYPLDNSEGARRYGARWNRPGSAVIYSSAHIAVATLEVLRHYGAIPADYQVIEITVPDYLEVETLTLNELPSDWVSNEPYSAAYGTEWASSHRTPVLCVPSAEILTASNYILNPAHLDFSAIHFGLALVDPIGPRLRSR